MAFVPVPATCRVDLVYNHQGETIVNVLHYTGSGYAELGPLEDLAEQVKIEWMAVEGVERCIHDDTTLNLIRVTSLLAETAPQIEYTDGLPLPGTIATGTALPGNVCVVVTKRTQFRGRSFRGRIYHGGMSSAQINPLNSNRISDTQVTNLVESYGGLRVLNTTAGDNTMCVVSYIQDHVALAAGVSTPVTHFTCEGAFDSQRRRLAGRGQ